MLLSSPLRDVRAIACKAAGLINSGTTRHVETVVEARIFSILIGFLESDDTDIMQDAAWALVQAVVNSHSAARHLVTQG